MFKVVVGHSDDPDSRSAISEVLRSCVEDLQGVAPSAGILLAASDFEHSLILDEINRVFPGIELIGGTTAGEISSVMGYQQDSLVLMLFASDEVEISAGLGRNISLDVVTATQQAVESAMAKTTTTTVKFCLTISESLTLSGDVIVDSLQQALSEDIPIFGGLSASQSPKYPTYQFFKNEVLQDSLPILLFSGSVLFSHGVANGWRPIGNKSKVTKAINNVVYEIGGKSAIDFYNDYLNTLPSEECPLTVFIDGKQSYTRSPMAYDLETGSVSFGGNMPVGSVVHVTSATRDEILAASETSIREALNTYPGKEPSAVLLFSCSVRRQILGSRTCEEYKLVKSCLLSSIPTLGFYSFGEISPSKIGAVNRFHNQTFVTLLVGV